MSYTQQQKTIHGDDVSSESDVEDETISSPLNDMSTLFLQLPSVKRGLSKHYDGKSQSFTSLSNVKCLEDLPKVESSFNKKKMKSCRSYAGLMFFSDDQNHPPTAAAAAAVVGGHEGYIGNSSKPPPIARSRISSSIYTTGALLFA